MKHHYFYFDFARVVAALCVLLVHARVVVLTPYSLLPAENQTLVTKAFMGLCTMGTDGVLVFFILSGFLVGGRRIDCLIRGEKQDPISFIVNRFFRIILPLFVALLLSSFQKIICQEDISWWNWLGNLFCLQEILVVPEMPVLWTISYEVVFYSVIASLLFMQRKKWIIGLLFFLFAVWAISRLRLPFIIVLLGGVIGYSIKESIQSHTFIVWGSALIGFFALICEKLSNEYGAFHILPSFIDYDIIICIEGMCLMVILSKVCMVKPNNTLQRFIEMVGVKYGKYSYSLFLSHYPVLLLVRHFSETSYGIDGIGLLHLFVTCIMCFAVAVVFYHLVEKNTKHLAEKVLSRNIK